MSTPKAAIYLRISSDHTGQELGVSRQREDCLALCEAKGWEPVEYIDNDISASSGKKRPAYERMLTDIREGRIVAVVCWDLDRLHRRPIELEGFMALADERHLALATASGDVDLSTAQGRLVARLKGSVAAHEIEHKRARQVRAAQQKAEAGRPQWVRAFGYDDQRQPHPVTAPMVREAYASVLAGGSISDVARTWNAAGKHGLTGKPWSASTVSLFLRSPRNCGLRSHQGQIVGKGTWPGLVDEGTWKATQSLLNAPGRAPGKKTVRQHPLTGVLQCGKPDCGGYLAGNWVMQKQAGGPRAHAITYTCRRCRGVSIRAEHVVPLVYDIVGGRLAKPDAADLLKAEIHDEAEAEALRTEAQALYGQIEEAEAEYDDGVIDGRRLAARKERVAEKLAVIERKQQDAERLRVLADIPLGEPEAVEAVKQLSPDRFRAVVNLLVTITVAPVGKGGHVFNPDRLSVEWR